MEAELFGDLAGLVGRARFILHHGCGFREVGCSFFAATCWSGSGGGGPGVVVEGRGTPHADWLGGSRIGVPSGVVWLLAGQSGVWGVEARRSTRSSGPPGFSAPAGGSAGVACYATCRSAWSAAQTASCSKGGRLSQAECSRRWFHQCTHAPVANSTSAVE